MSYLKILLLGVILLSGIISSSVSVPAQERFRYNPEAESLFTSGLDLYNSGAFENASEMFENALNINPVHQRTTACYLMAAKAWLQLQEQAQAMFLLNNVLKRFPESEYAREAQFTLGTTYYLLNDYAMSAKRFYQAIDQEKKDRISLKAEILLDSLITYVLTPAETSELLQETQSEYIKGIVSRNAMASAAPENEEQKEPVKLRHKSKKIKIGAMLPLMGSASSGPVKKAAEEILDGMQLARTLFEESDADIAIELDVRDTERDSALAKKFTKEFSTQKEYLAAIGPLFSNTTQSCAPLAIEGKLPLITPTANTIGIAAMGPYIFQANADVAMHGKALAEYAVNHLGLTTLAIIAPNNPMIKIITDQFTAEAKRLGATITASETYNKSSDDLRSQFLAIRKSSSKTEPEVSFEKRVDKQQRKRIIAAGAPLDLLDSLIEIHGKIPVNRLFGKDGLKTAERLNLKIVSPRSPSLNTEIPVTSIQGIFVPVVSSEDIGVIASQMTYYNIRTQLFGSAEWYDESLLETQKRYLDGVIFCSDYYMDSNDPAFITLSQQLKKKPSKYTLFGYDAMNLILSCISEGALSREQLRECLSNVQFYPGVHSSITLKGGRVNRTMQILQFIDGEVKRVREVTVE